MLFVENKLDKVVGRPGYHSCGNKKGNPKRKEEKREKRIS